ncbi:MAG: hypothetical protein KJZ91_27345 [Myxococcales bacterium]|nr:hypothetical protein [Myxococcales bacterium]
MRTRSITSVTAVVAGLALAAGGCKSDGPPDDWERAARGRPTAAEPPPPEEEDSWGDESGGTGTAMALEEGKMGRRDDRAGGAYRMKQGVGRGGGGAAPGAMVSAPAAPAPADNEADQPAGGDDANRPEGLTRAWFPETFLFEPVVVTDPSGAATVRVRVPDRLTSWRVLALAHARTGAQGGAVTSFLGTLPTYVDLIVPDTLVRGDEVRLPIQLVNTEERPVTAALAVEATGATLVAGGGVRTVPAQGALVEQARLVADRVGEISLRATLGRADAVVRTIEVVPDGRPETVTRTGTLALPRTLTLDGPAGADPATGRVRLQVYPGALALLRTELAVCTARQGVADDAYALMLAGNATAMLAALGDEADPEAVRTLSILTTQRAVRHGRTLDVPTATLLTEAALGHGDSPVVRRLGERAAAYLAGAQRPDGTFAGGRGWTLQRVLVATAEATRAVGADAGTTAARQRALGVRIAASGAFERNLDQVDDAYTAAAALASGALTGALADRMRQRVKDAIVTDPDGARHLPVGDGVVRADGARPSVVEATALAVLALAGDPQAPLADLGATLLGSYTPALGWGDGRTNLVALRAVLALFSTPVPEGVTVILRMDGVELARGVLDRARLKEVLVLEAAAPGLAGNHRWEVVAEPAVPGLGYALTLEGWVPWGKATAAAGLELALPETVTAAVGKPTEVVLRAVAPGGLPLHLQHALPAGVQVDTPSLEALVAAGTIERFVVATGKVDLYAPAQAPGQVFTASYRVIPTLAGRLRSAASRIEVDGTTHQVPPTTWIIK